MEKTLKTQDDSLEVLERTLRRAEEMNALGRETINELSRQGENLDRAGKNLDGIQTNLNRSEKKIKDISRAQSVCTLL